MAYKEYSEEFLQEIIEKVDLVDYVSKNLELVKKGRDYFSMCPFHEEDTGSLSVSPSKNMWYCFGCYRGGNIINFVQEYQKLSFVGAVEYLSSYTGLEQGETKPTPETIKFLKQFNKKKKQEKIKHIILPDNVMDKYSKEPILEWIWEGIDPNVMDKYQVRYDKNSNRIVFPIWDNDGNIINVKGRILFDNYADLGMSKYIYYYELGCNDFLYPLHFKRKIIRETGEVKVFEGSKSVYKCEGHGILDCLSLETSNINEYQIRQLLELHCDIVFCWDKGVNIEKLKDKIRVLTKFTNVYLVLDNRGLLKDKDSPIDKGLEIFQELYRCKIKL